MTETTVFKNTLDIRAMSEIELQEVKWLWKPYIPAGKITILEGDPGKGKTTLALRLAAACSTGSPMPGMEPTEPMYVIYQTAEDGLGDTIKPRLIDAGADETHVLNIVEDERSLTLLDERIEHAIITTGAKLIILDPIQGYLGDGVDMHRANDIRTVMKNIASVAERTGCAVVLVGHLNKTSGQNSAYRGLGSIDFYAAARSVLIVGQLKDQPNVRVIVHEKSSLSPNGESLAFSLGTEAGFHWLDGYEGISSAEILSGVIKSESKTSQAVELIADMLADGKEVHSEEILRAAEAMGISRRTVNAAKKSFPNMRTRKVGAQWMWSLEGKTPADALSEDESEEEEEVFESPPDETEEESPPGVDSLSEDISDEIESFAEESEVEIADKTTPEAFAAPAEDDFSE